MNNDNLIVFDLDDTLYKEIDFLKSGYDYISKILNLDIKDEMLNLYYQKQNVFNSIISKYNLQYTTNELIEIYRSHIPEIRLSTEVNNILKHFKSLQYKMAIVTDGFSVTQRNKIKALGIEDFFYKIVISEEIGTEKPNPLNYSFFAEFQSKNVFAIGDNTKKDFLIPNILGWKTFCLIDNGLNIHQQDFTEFTKYTPKYKINSLNDLKNIIN